MIGAVEDAAYGVPNLIEWLRASTNVEGGASFDVLADSTWPNAVKFKSDMYRRIDSRLSAALINFAAKNKSFGRHIERLQERSQSTNMRSLTGRQVLFELGRLFATSDQSLQYHLDIGHLQKMQWPGDSVEQMQTFYHDWMSAVHKQRPGANTDLQLLDTLHSHMKNSVALQA